ncbi:MAG: hypothetical protein A2Y38_07295 [Spirochaetes bacterium GWB1_59_5]|nr:MAG: hypothetical protein A2Y38_07295 [Spirochaetes bacterium GWB1_59_5]
MKASLSFRRARNALIALMTLSLAASCDVFGGLANPEDSGAALVRFVEPVNGTIDLSLYAIDPDREAYVVFTTGGSPDVPKPNASLESAARALAVVDVNKNRNGAEKAAANLRKLARETASSSFRTIKPQFSSTGDPSGDYPGLSRTFYVISNEEGTTFGQVAATCLYASGSSGIGDPVEPLDFGDDKRSLSIYAANDCADGSKRNTVTPAMVEAFALKFFGAAGESSDSIYAWVTNMLGAEWGSHAEPTLIGSSSYDLITPTESITILLADISNDNSDNGGIIGYFYSVDTMEGKPNSNERVMFVIDAVMYANPDTEGDSELEPGYYSDDGWTPTDYWARESFSTLAHEFQHLIHFYQKGVLRGGNYFDEPTWIDELCSMQVEDMLADKLGVPGPRGVDSTLSTAGASGNTSGRLPAFIYSPDISLEDWGGVDIYASYAAAYAFGAYLTRNYGGAAFIRSVVQSPFASVNSIVAAAEAFSGRDESIENLLRRWGAAVLLSDSPDAPEYYRYDAFSSDLGGVSYNLGAINVWNYSLGLDSDDDQVIDSYQNEVYVYTADTLSTMYGGAYSNAFMSLGDPSGKPDWKLTVPDGMFATIVID